MRRVFPLLLTFALLLGAGIFLFKQNNPSAPVPNSPTLAISPSTSPNAANSSAGEIDNTPGLPPRANPWPHDNSDISPDPRATFGQLENGLRYIIVPNAEPPGRAVIRLHIDAGSLMEKDDQRGVAHFLEHMVFNGSRNYAPGELIQKMQRLGIAFGAHANAYTSFDETVYMLDMPDVEPETMQLGMTVMRDFADGASLIAKEIDSERGVILSEMTSRDSVQQRLMEQQFSDLLPDSKITHRFPIGTEKVLKTVQRDRFTEFYKTYYAPQLMTFIVVGDIDPAATEASIAETFGSMKNRVELPVEDFGQITQRDSFDTSIYADPEVTNTSVSLVRIRQAMNMPDTRAERLQDLPLQVAHAIINRRFSKLAKAENSAILSGSASQYDLFSLVEVGSIDVDANEGRWEEAITVLEQTIRRAISYGFTKSELAEVKAQIVNQYEQGVQRAQTRQSSGIATQLFQSVNADRVFSTPEDDLEIVKAGVGNLTLADINSAFSSFWDVQDLTLNLTTQEAPAEGDSLLASIYNESKNLPVEKPEELIVVPWGYTDFGPISAHKETFVSDLEITQLQFENGVRVNLKQTDYEKNSVSIVARFGNGKLTMPLDMPGLDTFLGSVFIPGGLGTHSADQLENTLAGKNVGVAFGIQEDTFTLSGTTTFDDLLLQLQYMVAYITDHGQRDEALRQFRNSLPAIYNSLEHTQQGPLTDIQARIHNQDPRFVFPDQETLESYTFQDADVWLGPELASGYLELSLVGDFSTEDAIQAISSTFGALAPRQDSKPELYENRLINFLPSPDEKILVFDSKINKSLSFVIWQTKGLTGDIQETRRLNLLSSILGDRMREKIREELGAAYSPSAGSTQSLAFPNIGYIQAFSPGKPSDTRNVGSLIRDIADDMSKEGISEDELDRALQPLLTNLEASLRQNSYWLNSVLSQCQEDPERLEWARSRDEDFSSITLDDLDQLAAKYLAGSNSILFSILPESAE